MTVCRLRLAGFRMLASPSRRRTPALAFSDSYSQGPTGPQSPEVLCGRAEVADLHRVSDELQLRVVHP